MIGSSGRIIIGARACELSTWAQSIKKGATPVLRLSKKFLSNNFNMNPNILYLYILSTFAIFSNVFGYFSDSDSDGDGFRIRLGEGNETDDEMRAFNKRLDNAVDVINETFKLKVEPTIPGLIKEIENSPKPAKLTADQWEQIKQEKIAKLRDRLYQKFSAKYFRDYGNFVTNFANKNSEDYMTNYGGKSIFDLSDGEAEEIAHNVVNDMITEAGGSKIEFTPHKTRKELKKEAKKAKKEAAKAAKKTAKDAAKSQ